MSWERGEVKATGCDRRGKRESVVEELLSCAQGRVVKAE